FFFFNDTATTEIYTLSLHDALPIWRPWRPAVPPAAWRGTCPLRSLLWGAARSEGTRLNSSHITISYAVFCLKKKKKKEKEEIKKKKKKKKRKRRTKEKKY